MARTDPTADPRDPRLSASQLASLLRGRIVNYLPGSRLPGAEQLARQFGSSLHHVRLALASLVADGLLEARHREGHIVADHRETVRPIKRIHALVAVPQPGELFQQSILLGASQRCPRHGLGFFASEMRRDELGQLRPEDIDRLAGPGDPAQAGYLLVCNVPPLETIHAWLRRGLRLAVVDYESAGGALSCVTCNWREVIHSITEMLVLLGHRRIAYCGLRRNDLINLARMHGFELAARRHGLAPGELPVWDIGGGQGHQINVRRMVEWLSADRRPGGVVCGDEMLGYQMLVACEQVGLKVPEQISVIAAGFQRRELQGRLDRLTRLDAGRPERLGEMGVDLIAETPNLSRPVQMFVDFALVQGESIAPPA